MDTRNKIIPYSETAASSLTVVRMDCDPLLADVVASLQGPLYVLVGHRENAYLSTEARAELAASLATVRHVSIGEYPAGMDLRLQEAEARHALEQLVLSKSRA